MCITLSVKLGEELGQNRHFPGVNGCMVVSGEFIESPKGVSVEPVSRLEDRLIGEAVMVGEVTVVIISIKCVNGAQYLADLSMFRWYRLDWIE
jgi:hypothetical protein